MIKKTRVETRSKNNGSSLLIVDKDLPQRKGLTVALMDYFSRIEMTGDFETAIKLAEENSINIIITEFWFDNIEGMDAIKIFKKLFPYAEIIIVSRNIPVDNSKELIKLGVKSIYKKPINVQELIQEIKKLIQP